MQAEGPADDSDVVACQKRIRTVSKKLRQIAELRAAVADKPPQPAQLQKLSQEGELKAQLESLSAELAALELCETHDREQAAEREERRNQAAAAAAAAAPPPCVERCDPAPAAAAAAADALAPSCSAPPPAIQVDLRQIAPEPPKPTGRVRPCRNGAVPLSVLAPPTPDDAVGPSLHPPPRAMIPAMSSDDSIGSMDSGSAQTEVQRRVRNAQKRVRQASSLQEAAWGGRPLNSEQKAKVLSLPSLQQELRGLLAQLEEGEEEGEGHGDTGLGEAGPTTPAQNSSPSAQNSSQPAQNSDQPQDGGSLCAEVADGSVSGAVSPEARLQSTPRPKPCQPTVRASGSFSLPSSVRQFNDKTCGASATRGGMSARGSSTEAPPRPMTAHATVAVGTDRSSATSSTTATVSAAAAAASRECRASRRSTERLSNALVSGGSAAPVDKDELAAQLAALRTAAASHPVPPPTLPVAPRGSSVRRSSGAEASSLLRGSGTSIASWEEMADSGRLILPAEKKSCSPPLSASVRPSGKSVEEEEFDTEERRRVAREAAAAEEAQRKEEAKRLMLDKLYHFRSPARPAIPPAPHLFTAGAMPPGSLGIPEGGAGLHAEHPAGGEGVSLSADPLDINGGAMGAGSGLGAGGGLCAEVSLVEGAALGAEGELVVGGGLLSRPFLVSGDELDDDPPALSLDDFELLRLIGKGGYGKVFQVRCLLNAEVYAMKVVDKASIERFRSMDNIATELSVLRRYAEHRHPFILGLECAFQSPDKLHFVMEFVPGGMLFNHLRQQEMFSEKMARFYAAEVLLGLEHLHGMCIIYRDLKPENVLVCADGNVKLCDFGLAAIGLTAPATQPSASGRPVLIGTTEYMAPEIIRMLECGQAVDIWALGVLLYEMVTGEAPWYHKEAKELQRKIVHTKPKLPTWLAGEARNLLRGLLTKEARQRLGVRPESEAFESDASAIKAHPFFRGLNWKMLEMRKLEPPLLPALAHGALDVSNFDAKYTLERPEMSPPKRPLSTEMEARFSTLDLEYVSPETRNSVRASMRSSAATSVGSTRSSRRSPSSSEAHLRFAKNR